MAGQTEPQYFTKARRAGRIVVDGQLAWNDSFLVAGRGTDFATRVAKIGPRGLYCKLQR